MTFTLPEEGVVLAEVEKSFIEQALARTNGNQSKAAKLLGVTRYAFRHRAEKYKILPPGAKRRRAERKAVA